MLDINKDVDFTVIFSEDSRNVCRPFFKTFLLSYSVIYTLKYFKTKRNVKVFHNFIKITIIDTLDFLRCIKS